MMDAHSELERLLIGQFEGPPDAARNRMLADLLRARPELQTEYIDHLQMHALLQWRGGQAAPVARQECEKARPAVDIVHADSSHRRWRRGFAAVLLITAASIAAFFFFQPAEVQAQPDLVERLVELNVSLTQLPTRTERVRVFDEQAEALTATLANSLLTPADRELAEALLENGVWMTRNDDPMAEAERFNDIADKLVTHMDAATKAKDPKKMVKLASTYQRLTDAGIDPNMKRAAAGLVDGERNKKLERTALRQAERAKTIAAIVEQSPEASWREIHRAFKAIKAKK